jgi:N-acetylmuramoyl-L-alanine amidase
VTNPICISSGHGGKVAGAIGILNEHNEAVKVVEKVAEYLRQAGVTTYTFHDNTSTTQNQNLATIVGFHNSKSRELDVSVHFNAASRTDSPRGTEVLYVTESGLSAKVSSAISASSGLINRGGKKNTGLYFLNKTAKPAILIEVCFVDSSVDANIYNSKFNEICKAIAETLSGKSIASQPTQSVPVQSTPQPTTSNLYRIRKSWADASSQIGAYSNLDSAINIAKSNAGYNVYDSNGSQVYPTASQPTPQPIQMYRVRLSWADNKTQIGAFSVLDNAKLLADQHVNEGYKVFDNSGNAVYSPVVQVTQQPEIPKVETNPIDIHEGHHDIAGQSNVSAEKMAAFVKSVNPNIQDIDEIAKQFVEVGNKYGIRGDAAFCQSIIETGYFKFDGGTAVTPEQRSSDLHPCPVSCIFPPSVPHRRQFRLCTHRLVLY